MKNDKKLVNWIKRQGLESVLINYSNDDVIYADKIFGSWSAEILSFMMMRNLAQVHLDRSTKVG